MSAAALGLEQSSDAELLQVAADDDRILLTRDRDFGSLVFVNKIKCGVIYLRVLPSTLQLVHDELLRVLAKYTEDEFNSALVVIEPARHRIRKIT